MPEDQPLPSWWRLPALPGDDLGVGAADADGDDLDEHLPLALVRLVDVGQLEGVLLLGNHGEGAHLLAVPSGPSG